MKKFIVCFALSLLTAGVLVPSIALAAGCCSSLCCAEQAPCCK